MSPEQIQYHVTGHTSDAFQRYFLPDCQVTIAATRAVADMQKGNSRGVVVKIGKKAG